MFFCIPVGRRNVTYWCGTHYDLLYSGWLVVTTAVVVVTEAGVSGLKPQQCLLGDENDLSKSAGL